jgi:hypothetical protein
LLVWFWLTAYAICLGAELNSHLEMSTTQDTTIAPPAKPGKRGAYVADHVEKPEHAAGPTPQAPSRRPHPAGPIPQAPSRRPKTLEIHKSWNE